jgi:Tfp pilus assembly protein PilF
MPHSHEAAGNACVKGCRGRDRPGGRWLFRGRGLTSHLAVLLVAVALAACGTATPSSIDQERTAAVADIRSGDCAAAIQHLNEVIAADPQDLTLRRERADCYRKLKNLSKAIADYQFVASTNASSDALVDLAGVQWTAGETEAAKANLLTASKNTTDPRKLLQIAATQRIYGDVTPARTTLTQVQVPFRNFEWYMTLGAVDGLEAESNKFEKDFATALALAPDSSKPQVLVALGDARWRRAEYQTALGSYQQAIAKQGAPDRFRIFSQIADCFVHLNKLAEAVTNYKAALNEQPDEDFRESLELSLARTLILMRQYSEAGSVLSALSSDRNISEDTRQQVKALQAVIAGR